MLSYVGFIAPKKKKIRNPFPKPKLEVLFAPARFCPHLLSSLFSEGYLGKSARKEELFPIIFKYIMG